MTMKVHPTPKKRNINPPRYDVASSTITTNPNPKKLKRLPHIFGKVLELPFHSDVDVLIQETPDSFRFIANSEDMSITDHFHAHVIEIFPGVTRIVIRGTDGGGDSLVGEAEIDTWRSRLPATTRVEMASAMCIGGQLVVTVPKAVNVEDSVIDDEGEGSCNDRNGNSRLVFL